MVRRITLTITDDEAEILLEALETDREIYLQSARDAVADGSHDLAIAFGHAADRICTFRSRLQREVAGSGFRQ